MYENITRFNSPNYTREQDSLGVFGFKRVVSGITIHHWGDPAVVGNFDQTVSYLCRANGSSSAHTVVEAGRVAWVVDAQNVAWHAGNARGNATTLGYELNPRASQGDYDTAAELIAQTRLTYGDLPLYPHKYWKATQCPGAYNLVRLDQMARDWQKRLSAKSPRAEYVTVRSGATLSSIARETHTTVAAITALNGLKNPNLIRIGQRLRVR